MDQLPKEVAALRQIVEYYRQVSGPPVAAVYYMFVRPDLYNGFMNFYQFHQMMIPGLDVVLYDGYIIRVLPMLGLNVIQGYKDATDMLVSVEMSRIMN